MQNTLQENGNDDVKIERTFDIKNLESIIRQAGSPSLKRELAYLRKAEFYGKEKFKCGAIAGGVGFYVGTLGKSRFRLVSIAVVKQHQGKGYGAALMFDLIQNCRKRGIKKITLRTNRHEKAANFYKKFGGKIVGINGDDWEMEIPICFT